MARQMRKAVNRSEPAIHSICSCNLCCKGAFALCSLSLLPHVVFCLTVNTSFT